MIEEAPRVDAVEVLGEILLKLVLSSVSGFFGIAKYGLQVERGLRDEDTSTVGLGGNSAERGR